MLRYGDLLRRAIESTQRMKVAEWAPGAVFGKLAGALPAKAVKQLRNVDKYVLGMAAAPRGRTDFLVFADHSNAIYANRLRSRVRISVCHDLIPHLLLDGALAGRTPSRTGELLAKSIVQNLRQMDVVVCISEATRRDVVRLTGIDPNRTRVIYNPCSPQFTLPADPASAALEARRELGLPAKAALAVHVGGEKFYKNRPAVVRIFARAAARHDGESHLLMVGPDTPALRALAAEQGVADRITIRPHLDERGLQTAYHAGGVFIFPSIYEGFGWPVLEAQASGCPVVCSDAASLPEVAGEGASVHPVDDEAGMAEAIAALWADGRKAQAMIARGIENVGRFQWQGFETAISSLIGEFT
jgi:glycosyltransferase involved in cell wall biosynthesis